MRPRARYASAASRTNAALWEAPSSSSRAAQASSSSVDELLAIYTALRPGRSSADELEAWAARLDELGAAHNAAFVREAAEAYRARGLTADA